MKDFNAIINKANVELNMWFNSKRTDLHKWYIKPSIQGIHSSGDILIAPENQPPAGYIELLYCFDTSLHIGLTPAQNLFRINDILKKQPLLDY